MAERAGVFSFAEMLKLLMEFPRKGDIPSSVGPPMTPSDPSQLLGAVRESWAPRWRSNTVPCMYHPVFSRVDGIFIVWCLCRSIKLDGTESMKAQDEKLKSFADEIADGM